MFFLQVDIDADTHSPDQGIQRSMVELEDYSQFMESLALPEGFFKISEDDFELLAELITEISEADEGASSDVDFDEDDEA